MLNKKTNIVAFLNDSQENEKANQQTYSRSHDFSQDNYLAIDFLECIGIGLPSQEQISLLENLLAKLDSKKQKLYSNIYINELEKNILFSYAGGLKDQKIADKFSMTERNLRKIKRNIYRKTGSKTITQAVYQLLT